VMVGEKGFWHQQMVSVCQMCENILDRKAGDFLPQRCHLECHLAVDLRTNSSKTGIDNTDPLLILVLQRIMDWENLIKLPQGNIEGKPGGVLPTGEIAPTADKVPVYQADISIAMTGICGINSSGVVPGMNELLRALYDAKQVDIAPSTLQEAKAFLVNEPTVSHAQFVVRSVPGFPSLNTFS
jgi:hypothetical protein